MSEASGAAGEGFATMSRNGVGLDASFLKLELQYRCGRNPACSTRRAGLRANEAIRRVDVVPIRTEIASLQCAPVDSTKPIFGFVS